MLSNQELEAEVERLMEDREAFNAFVYTPWREALKELERRQADTKLEEYVERALPAGLPEAMSGKESIVLFRHIATSNHEMSRFAMCADAIPELRPLIFEYTADKFNDRNEWKYFLGKLRFHKGRNSKGEPLFEQVGIINFNESNNKPLASIQTHWNENLVDFHHRLFEKSFPQLKESVHDLSEWLHIVGPTAKEYYQSFFTLFLQGGILLENFLVDGTERSFTKDVILPALLRIVDETGHKPLIVALEPTDIEGDRFWLSHPHSVRVHLDAKIPKSI